MNAPASNTQFRRIQPLPTHLANQIAAGEVVERPASVVKELLENSIDADARHIELEIEQGGVRLIRVSDDGAGIHPDDLPLAVAQHATSKVYNQHELQHIDSLGFRGEALASIASVSRFTLASRARGEEQGNRLGGAGVEAGAPITPCAMPPGTRVEVRELFYNTPARRKFLRSERTEYLHIEEVLKRLALSRYDVGFRLLHNGRQFLNLNPIDKPHQHAQRVATVLGKGFLQHALEVEFEAAGMRLHGWVGEPGYSRSQADAQYFYLNGRMIRDKLITHALRQAHQSALEPGRYPAYLLYLELDPQQVDVNVHPTKHEVRFREARLVHDFLLRALERAFGGYATPTVEETMGEGGGLAAAVVAEAPAAYRRPLEALPVTEDNKVTTPSRLLAVVDGAYLLLHRRGEVRVLQVIEARELLLLHRFVAFLENGEAAGQPLLIPATVCLDEGGITLLERYYDTLVRLGIVIERLGEGTVVVRQLPRLLRGAEMPVLVPSLADALVRVPDVASDNTALVTPLAQRLAPLLPLPDTAAGEVLLRELEQLLLDGCVTEDAVPWLTLDRERFSTLFTANR